MRVGVVETFRHGRAGDFGYSSHNNSIRQLIVVCGAFGTLVGTLSSHTITVPRRGVTLDQGIPSLSFVSFWNVWPMRVGVVIQWTFRTTVSGVGRGGCSSCFLG